MNLNIKHLYYLKNSILIIQIFQHLYYLKNSILIIQNIYHSHYPMNLELAFSLFKTFKILIIQRI
jgi:hypothetical protein